MQGVSINTFDLQNKTYPLIYSGDAPNITGGFNSSRSRYIVVFAVITVTITVILENMFEKMKGVKH